MRLLTAEQFAPGRFRRVTVQRCNADGRNFSPGFGDKLAGTLAACCTRSAAAHFAAEPAARGIAFDLPGGSFRVDRID